MSKTTHELHFGPIKVEVVTFIILLVVVLGSLVGMYYYDLQQPFFSIWAKQFYNWLIN